LTTSFQAAEVLDPRRRPSREGCRCKLRSVLGIADVTFKRGRQRLAIIDRPLHGSTGVNPRSQRTPIYSDD
jgi:hypothetical protein